MDYLWDGIQIGLVLCLLTGPIFFALLQTGIEEGVVAGMAVGLGIWVSDFLFIGSVLWGLQYLLVLTEGASFTLWVGILGGLVLLSFGIGTALTKPPTLSFDTRGPQRSSTWTGLWLKGFLINTLNPFTFFFWMGIASTAVTKEQLGMQEQGLFFGGIMGIVILTDFLKVYLSRRIRHFLQYKHLVWLRYVSGFAFAVFGVVLLLRVLFFI